MLTAWSFWMMKIITTISPAAAAISPGAHGADPGMQPNVARRPGRGRELRGWAAGELQQQGRGRADRVRWSWLLGHGSASFAAGTGREYPP
jgi:hypothetical protein